jgi:nucleoside-diphosphate-sugar epimerase
LLLAQKGKSGEVYCVGSGHSRIMKDYIEELSDVMGKTCTIGYGDLPYGDNTVMHLAVDISKIRNEIGFEPQISFKDGIIKTIDWAKVYFSQNSEV